MSHVTRSTDYHQSSLWHVTRSIITVKCHEMYHHCDMSRDVSSLITVTMSRDQSSLWQCDMSHVTRSTVTVTCNNIYHNCDMSQDLSSLWQLTCHEIYHHCDMSQDLSSLWHVTCHKIYHQSSLWHVTRYTITVTCHEIYMFDENHVMLWQLTCHNAIVPLNDMYCIKKYACFARNVCVTRAFADFWKMSHFSDTDVTVACATSATRFWKVSP